MFNSLSRILCGFFVIGIMLSATGCHQQEIGTGAGYLFSTVLPADPQCLDPQYTDNPNAEMVICNIMEGLLRKDKDGFLTEAGAESYVISDDGLSYMFNLRTDCVWHRYNSESSKDVPVTAKDYVYAFQRIFNPETHSPFAEDFLCLKNASGILDGTVNYKNIGVSAPDAETVIFTLEYPDANFLELLALPCAVPCNEEFFLSTNGRYGLAQDMVLCNGPFCLLKWNYDQYGSDNFLTFFKNETFYDKENVYPSDLTFTIMKSRTAADQTFDEDAADVILTPTYKKQYFTDKYTVESDFTQTLGLIFNPENPVMQNDSLREALILGMERSAAYQEIGDDLMPAYGIIPPAVTLLGRSYRELYADEPLAPRQDAVLAAELFRQGMEELELNGTGSIRILVPNTFENMDSLLAIGQGWQDLFGSYIGIETVSPQEYAERLEDGRYSLALYSIRADRNDCWKFLKQFEEQAEFLDFSSETFDTLLPLLQSPEKLSDAVEQYGKAEAAILETGRFIPLFYKREYLVYTSGNRDISCDLFSGTVSFRDAKHFG